jgi:hypothetical protein
MAYKSIQDLDLKDKCVFIRVDFNVPLDETGKKISSDTRIRAALPTINLALEKGAKVGLVPRIALEHGERALVLLPDPGDGFLALDLFQKHVRVGIERRHGLLLRTTRHGGHRHQTHCKPAHSGLPRPSTPGAG